MTDKFRLQPRELDEDDKSQIEAIKTKAAELDKLISEGGGSPERTLASRKLQECVFWATYAITE